jgi:SAM-dependent methyltransferase
MRTLSGGDHMAPLTMRAALRYDVVSRLVSQLSPAAILEIGCGQGAVGSRLASRSEYTGVEPDGTAFAVARDRIVSRGGRALHGTTEVLDPTSRFDLVCAFEVLEHIEDDVAALVEWAKFIKSGGYLLLSVPAFQDRYGAGDAAVGHFRRYSPSELTGRMSEAGLAPRKTLLYGWPICYGLDAVRNRAYARKLTSAAKATMTERSAASGRSFQPQGRLAGAAIWLLTAPFRYLQRLRPNSGTGLIVLAQKQPLDE